jgi:hypothetical protein
VLYVAHDTTLGPVLLALGQTERVFPPVGSHIVFEVFRAGTAAAPRSPADDLFARVSFNGRPLALPLCGGQTVCPLDRFLAGVRQGVWWRESARTGRCGLTGVWQWCRPTTKRSVLRWLRRRRDDKHHMII